MDKIDATAHAKKRMQQRAINAYQLRLVEVFGEYRYQKGGANLAYIPEKTLLALRKAIDNLSKVRVVFGESDRVITALHEKRHIRKTLYAA